MERKIKDLKMLVNKAYDETLAPSISIYCPPNVIDLIKEHWDNNSVKTSVFICPTSQLSPLESDDKIFVIPELDKH